MPLTIIVFVLAFPALIIGFAGWWSKRATRIAAGLAAFAVALDFVFWTKIVREVAHKSAQ